MKQNNSPKEFTSDDQIAEQVTESIWKRDVGERFIQRAIRGGIVWARQSERRRIRHAFEEVMADRPSPWGTVGWDDIQTHLVFE